MEKVVLTSKACPQAVQGVRHQQAQRVYAKLNVVFYKRDILIFLLHNHNIVFKLNYFKRASSRN